MTEVESKRISTLLVAAYPAWKPSEATMQLYERLLLPLEAALAEQVMLQIIRTPREFAPPVGSICYQAARLALQRGEGALSAEETWAEVAAAIRSHGSYREPSFTNPALARAVAAMDWSELCTNSNVEATRAHFFRLFGAFQEGRIARRVEELGSAMRPTGRTLVGALVDRGAERTDSRTEPALGGHSDGRKRCGRVADSRGGGDVGGTRNQAGGAAQRPQQSGQGGSKKGPSA
jgi:hypothetical protein